MKDGEEMKIIKVIILGFIFILFYNFLEHGFTFDKAEKIIIPILLSLVTVSAIFQKSLRNRLLKISFVSFGVMVVFYLFNNLDWSNQIGSFGFAVFVIVIASYASDFLKKGYIENF